ncbi:hypothetical protein V6N12_068601 [Hibiscus sabdariffa]|uniref:Heparanase-like protein 2 n=1 Tax=Hibiscus sabdariffa TaxID=183260 RepID=A0ABR2FQL7_9ROSI
MHNISNLLGSVPVTVVLDRFCKLLSAFNPWRIKVGGSLQDNVAYKVGEVKSCPDFLKKEDGLFQFSQGFLSMERWDQLNTFFNHTGAQLTFGLNSLFRRNESQTEKGARVDAKQYGKDVIVLKNLVKELYADPGTRPKVLGPGGFYDEKWFNTFLEVSEQGIVDGDTHHIYNLGPGDDPNLMSKILDPLYLSQVSQRYKGALNVVKKFRPQSGAWVSESGGASNCWRKRGCAIFFAFGNEFPKFCSLVYSGGLSRDLDEIFVEIQDPIKRRIEEQEKPEKEPLRREGRLQGRGGYKVAL